MNYDIDLDVDDILMGCSKREKKELLEALLEDGDLADTKEAKEKERKERQAQRKEVLEYLEELSSFDLNRLLCDVFGIIPYCDKEALREKLEEIINA